MRLIDLTGRRFGRLTVLHRAAVDNRWQPRWLCRCVCGNSVDVVGGNLRNGHTLSCGCLQAEKAAEINWRHGLTARQRHPLGSCYSGMIQRCGNPKHISFKRYGGRGISVCDRWLSGEGGKTGFQCFVEDMGPRPSSSHSIDRVDNGGNYEPGNCCWATPVEQAANRRTLRGAEANAGATGAPA